MTNLLRRVDHVTASIVANRKWQRYIGVTMLMTHSLLVLRLSTVTSPEEQQGRWSRDTSDFSMALTSRADADRFILLSMVDDSFVDMAANFVESSLIPNDIFNFLFVGVGQRACETLREISSSVACFHYVDDVSSGLPSSFNTADHNRKMNYRTDMILDALGANFTVLHTDVDVVLFVNPINELKTLLRSSEADVLSLWDESSFNAGFIVLRPTAATQLLYNTVRLITSSDAEITDQKALNKAIKQLEDNLKVVKLNSSRYMSGFEFFEKREHWFPKLTNISTSKSPANVAIAAAAAAANDVDADGSDGGLVAVHNNWIVGKAAKVYRFKEHLMWLFDSDGSYYGSTTRRYITYTNPAIQLQYVDNRWQSLTKSDQDLVTKSELTALKTALTVGYVLNMTVILPRFHVGRFADERPLNSLIDITVFDEYFAGSYRENSFLHHPKIPANIRNSMMHETVDLFGRSPPFPGSVRPGGFKALRKRVVSSRMLAGLFAGPLGRYSEFNVVMLNGLSLVHTFVQLPVHSSQSQDFRQKLKRAFVRSEYRQFNTSMLPAPPTLEISDIVAKFSENQNENQRVK